MVLKARMMMQASIYLTSNQKVFGFKPANDLPKNAQRVNKWTNPQILITSDRLMLNAKNDSVFIIGKTDVGIITKDWRVEMNEFFNIVKDLLKILSDSAINMRALAPYNGSGPAINPDLSKQYKVLIRNLNKMTQ